jgi:hypothetical protein
VRVARRRDRLQIPPTGYAGHRTGGHPATPRADSAAGFSDVDNTMLRGASICYLARGLATRKYFFTTGDLFRFGVGQLRFRVMAREHGGDVSRARQAANGWEIRDFRTGRVGRPKSRYRRPWARLPSPSRSRSRSR